MEDKARERRTIVHKAVKTCLLYQRGVTAYCTWQTIQITVKSCEFTIQSKNYSWLPYKLPASGWLICSHLLEDIKANGYRILQSWAFPHWNLLMLSRSFVFQIDNQKILLKQQSDWGSNKGVPYTSRIRKDKEILLQA